MSQANTKLALPKHHTYTGSTIRLLGVYYILVIISCYLFIGFANYKFDSINFSVFYLLLVMPGLKAYIKKFGSDIFNPLFAFVIVFYLYTMGSGLFTEKYHEDTGGSYIMDDTISEFYFLCLVSICFIILGMLSPYLKNKNTLSTATEKDASELNPIKMAIFALVFALPYFNRFITKFNFITALSYKENALSSRIIFRDNLDSGLIDTIFVDGPIFLLIASIIIVLFGKKYSVFYKIISLIVLCCYLFTLFKSGLRGIAVNTLIIPLIYYHYKIKKIKITPLRLIYFTLIGLVFYASFRAMETMRNSSNISEMVELFQEEFAADGWQIFALYSVGELLVGTNQMYLMQSLKEGAGNYTYGKSIINEFLVFIPRSIYPNRPLPLSEEYVHTFYKDTWDAGGGFGLYVTMEGYWTFGIIGVTVFCFVFGYVLQKIYYRLTSSNTTYHVFLYTNFYTWAIVYATRSGMVSVFKSFIISVLTMVLYHWFCKIRFPNRI